MVDINVHSSEAVTSGIRVTVTSQFSHAEPGRQRWYFTYTVRIANEGAETVTLVSRHWIITNGSNKVKEVRGRASWDSSRRSHLDRRTSTRRGVSSRPRSGRCAVPT